MPSLAEQHWLEEGLRQLYQCPDRAAAQQHFRTIVLNTKAGDDASTVLWARTLRRWGQAILGYFRYPISNGFTDFASLSDFVYNSD